MRTERITLEVTGAPGWRVHVNGIDVESVRVVEEPESTDLRHRWDRDGERCLKCRDKDWMGGPCSTTDDEYIAALTAERDAAIRERDEFRRALTVENDHALQIKAEHDALGARIAALEAQTSTAGEGSCEVQAASGGNSTAQPYGSQAASGGGEELGSE